MEGTLPDRRPPTCPGWCIVRHGAVEGEDDHVHLSSALLVRRTVLRLAATIDPRTGTVEGPHLLAGSEEYSVYEEYSLHEAEALIDALTQLVEAGGQLTSPA